MPKFFSERKEPYNLRSRSKNQSTPKSKVDTCVECDLPFDESKIAPELRRGPVAKEGTSSEPLEPSHKNSVGFNKTNLEPVDSSVDSDSDDSLSALDPRRLRALVESEEELYSENERDKEKEQENCIFSTTNVYICRENAAHIGGFYFMRLATSERRVPDFMVLSMFTSVGECKVNEPTTVR